MFSRGLWIRASASYREWNIISDSFSLMQWTFPHVGASKWKTSLQSVVHLLTRIRATKHDGSKGLFLSGLITWLPPRCIRIRNLLLQRIWGRGYRTNKNGLPTGRCVCVCVGGVDGWFRHDSSFFRPNKMYTFIRENKKTCWNGVNVISSMHSNTILSRKRPCSVGWFPHLTCGGALSQHLVQWPAGAPLGGSQSTPRIYR